MNCLKRVSVGRWAVFVLVAAGSFAHSAVEVHISVRDGAGGPLLPCRIHLQTAGGEYVQAPGLPFNQTHFVCPGQAALSLEPNEYRYEIERGHEYRRLGGTFTVSGKEPVKLELATERMVHLADEGWYSGDLHIHRPLEDMKLLIDAEDLNFGAVTTWWNGKNAWFGKPLPEDTICNVDSDHAYDIMVGEDEHGGGALMYYRLAVPLDIIWAEHEWPGPMHFAMQTLWQKGAWIDIEKPFWLDVPTVLAHGFGNSIGIANNHIWRNGMLDEEAWGKGRDKQQFPSPYGNALWSQAIYFHILNCGFRIPPSAGSASGVMPNSIGYNRVYVHTDGAFAVDKWWDGLAAGRCFVTNGPLLRVSADGKLPGYVFKLNGPAEIKLEAKLDCMDPIRSVEIIQNGRVVRQLSWEEFKSKGLGRLAVEDSGWFVVRATADVEHTYRFAMTGPYYVEMAGQGPFVREESAKFFLDWVGQRAESIKLEDARKRKEVLAYHEYAIRWWQKKLEQAKKK